MIYYEIKQKCDVFGNVCWNTIANYKSKNQALTSYGRIRNKENFKLVEIIETEVEK